MSKKRIIIVGAGPGGLTSGMLLAHKGMEVIIYEKDPVPGGRNKALEIGDFTFDTGPTFLMLKTFLEDKFKATGRNASDYLNFMRLDPLYRLQFPDRALYPAVDKEEMKRQIGQTFPGNEAGFEKFMQREGKRFQRLIPCLQKDYSSPFSFLDPGLVKALPHLSLGSTIYKNLGKYFDSEDLKLAFTFQSKYLGMSPWECPALFTMLSYMEYAHGIYHVKGGLNKISDAMAKVCIEEGAQINYSQKVKKLLMKGDKGKTVKGVVLENGESVQADAVVVNADFGYAVCNLLPSDKLRKWAPHKLEKKKFSCGTFMLYLGLDKIYETLNHHNIIFADDYKSNVDIMFNDHKMTDDFSFYVQNASVTDTTLAPEGKSTLYVLVPVPNNRSAIDWDAERQSFRDKVIDRIAAKTEMEDLREHIEVEKIITPKEWEDEYNVYIAAEFNLAHNLSQMLYMRPHNEFEELKNLYLTGGGTHPGSGLPTIYESGRIVSDLISKRFL